MLTLGLVLTSCSTDIIKSETTKENLEKENYSVSVWGEEEAKLRVENIEWNVKVVDVLYANKDNKDYLLAFYHENADDATKFLNENVELLNFYAEARVDKPAIGVFNNVTYAGSETSVKLAKLTLE